MSTETYKVAAFVDDLRRLSAQFPSDKEMLPQITPLVLKLANSDGWLQDKFFELDPTQGIGISVLHEEADHSLMVETVAWGPGGGVLPHDHQTWGVVAGISGTERNTLWKRHDDGSQPGHAKITVHRQTNVGSGDVIGFLRDDIHSVVNESETTSLSLHVYGKNLGYTKRNEYVPDEDIIRPCPVRAKLPA